MVRLVALHGCHSAVGSSILGAGNEVNQTAPVPAPRPLATELRSSWHSPPAAPCGAGLWCCSCSPGGGSLLPSCPSCGVGTRALLTGSGVCDRQCRGLAGVCDATWVSRGCCFPLPCVLSQAALLAAHPCCCPCCCCCSEARAVAITILVGSAAALWGAVGGSAGLRRPAQPPCSSLAGLRGP